jgi:uncharacterized membrane protein YoaK (UPF0700 family)
MAKKFIRNLTGKERSRKADTQLGILLAFVAGAINAGGFLAVGQYTSHMTGVASSIADNLALGSFSTALISLGFLISFILGAATSAITINWARLQNYSCEFALALMLEAVLMLIFGICAANFLNSVFMPIWVVVSVLCFTMGLQNAIITKVSDARIRTTHVTGLVTDIGIEIGKFFYSLVSAQIKPDTKKLRLHSSLLASFLLGGLFGAISFKYIGFVTTIPLALMLIIVAAVPIIDDFRAGKKEL